MKEKSFNEVRRPISAAYVTVGLVLAILTCIFVVPYMWGIVAAFWNPLADLFTQTAVARLPRLPCPNMEGLGFIDSAAALMEYSDGMYQVVCITIFFTFLPYSLLMSLKDYENYYGGSWAGPTPARGKTTHGGAMLISNPRMIRRVTIPWRSGSVPKGGSLVVGAGTRGELLLYDDVHYGVLGQSGDGKSRRVIVATIVANVLQGKTVIVNDIKGELGDWVCPWAKRLGTHRVVRIRLDDPAASDVRYDPLASARRHVEKGEMGDTVEELRELAACLIKTAGAGHDNFFPETARTLFLGLCLFVLTSPDVPDDCRNLSTVAALIEATGETDQMGRLLQLRKTVGDDSPARGFLGVVAGERGGGPGVVSEVSRALAPFVDPKIDVLMHDDELDLDRLGEVPTLLFISSSAATGDRGPVVNAFFSQTISALRTCAKRHGKRLPVPSVLVMDEFASIGRLERLMRDIGEIRSEGITLIACWQSLHQLQATSGYTREEAKNLLDQLHTKLVLSCGDTEIAEMLSKTIGVQTVTAESMSRTKYYQGGSTGTSDSLVSRPVMTVDEIMRWSPYDGHLLITKRQAYAIGSRDISQTFVAPMLGMGEDGSGWELQMLAEQERTERNTEHAHVWRVPEKGKAKADSSPVPDDAFVDYPGMDDGGVVAPPSDYMPDGFYE